MRVGSTHRFPGPAWDALDDVVVGERPDAEALIVMNTPVAFDAHPNLKLIANFSVGYDNVDLDEARRRGVAVTNTPGVLDATTADLAFALLLAARRRVVEGDRLVRAGGWNDPQYLGRDVSGATIAVVGVGRIGSAFARRAAGFDMRVLGLTSREGDLDAALREADAVSLHVPLNESTRGLISRERLALLRDGATLVNTARGAVVDEDALVDELASGRIGAGLDVFAHQPRVPDRLLDLPNVVLTPHLGSATVETRAEMTRIVVENILAFERDEPLLTPVLEAS